LDLTAGEIKGLKRTAEVIKKAHGLERGEKL
jgi:hypothetical protein